MKNRILPSLVLVVIPTLIIAGWTEVTPMPAAPSGKAIKSGGWLVHHETDDLIYAAKGYKTGDFYSYDIETDVWTALTAIPEGTEGKLPKRGAEGVWDGGNLIYAIKGNNTLGFWAYNISEGTWSQKPDVPLGQSEKKIKGGSDLAYVDGFVYLLKGFKPEFFRFNVEGDSWEVLPDAPRGKNPKWAKGSWLVFDGEGNLYAHKGKYHEFWTFDLATQAWATEMLTGMPRPSYTGKKKKAQEGSSATLHEGMIYALKGGNTCEFWVYDLETGTWVELDTLPIVGSTGRKKTVKHGGDIVSIGDGEMMAIKGKKSLEVWHYTPPAPMAGASGPDRDGIAARSSLVAVGGRLLLGPRYAGQLTAELYSLAGVRLASREVEADPDGRVELQLSGLRPGVYLARFEARGLSTVRKLVVE